MAEDCTLGRQSCRRESLAILVVRDVAVDDVLELWTTVVDASEGGPCTPAICADDLRCTNEPT